LHAEHDYNPLVLKGPATARHSPAHSAGKKISQRPLIDTNNPAAEIEVKELKSGHS
jgi:hypothetical protein